MGTTLAAGPIDRTTLRKEVWRAVRLVGANSITELDMRFVLNPRKGLYVYEDQRGVYCDGRSKPEQFYFSLVTRRMIVFLPEIEEERMAQATSSELGHESNQGSSQQMPAFKSQDRRNQPIPIPVTFKSNGLPRPELNLDHMGRPRD